MSFRGLWRHVHHNYREGGVRQVVSKIGARLRDWAWSDSVWLIYRIELAQYRRTVPLRLKPAELDFAALHRHGYAKATAFPEVIQARFESGTRCVGFFVEGMLANLAWTTSGYLEIEPGLSLGENNCIGIFDCLTFPEHRSRGYYTESLIQLAQEARSRGAGAVLIAVDPGNVPSVKGIERAGFAPYFRISRGRRLGRAVVRRSGFELRFERS